MRKTEINEYLKELDNKIGQRIYHARSILGVTRKELARFSGVSIQQLAKYENGVNRVSMSRLSLIAEKLKTKIEDFSPGSVKSNLIENRVGSKNLPLLVQKLSKLQNAEQQKALIVILDGLL